MRKINTLTQEQKQLLNFYVDKWKKINLNTDKFTLEEAQEWCNYLYEKIMNQSKVPVIVADSPISAMMIISQIIDLKTNGLFTDNFSYFHIDRDVAQSMLVYVHNSIQNASINLNSLHKSELCKNYNYFTEVSDNLKNKLKKDLIIDPVWNKVQREVRAHIHTPLNDIISSVSTSSLITYVLHNTNTRNASVEAAIKASIFGVCSNPLFDCVDTYLKGSLATNLLCLGDYFESVLNVDYGEFKLNWEWYKSSAKFGQVYPLDDVCVITQKPIEINLKPTGINGSNLVPHADGKAAIKYADGFAIYALNGVLVSKYLVKTPAEELDPNYIRNIKNADIRTEFIRKIGIDKLISFGHVIDHWENYRYSCNYDWYRKSEYKLIDMSSIFAPFAYMPYLYMKNQTVPNTYHLECVFNEERPPRTILDALKFRFGGIDPESIEISSIA